MNNLKKIIPFEEISTPNPQNSEQAGGNPPLSPILKSDYNKDWVVHVQNTPCYKRVVAGGLIAELLYAPKKMADRWAEFKLKQPLVYEMALLYFKGASIKEITKKFNYSSRITIYNNIRSMHGFLGLPKSGLRQTQLLKILLKYYPETFKSLISRSWLELAWRPIRDGGFLYSPKTPAIFPETSSIDSEAEVNPDFDPGQSIAIGHREKLRRRQNGF